MLEGIEEGGLGALMHPWYAAETVPAGAETNEGGEEASGGSGIADVEFERSRPGSGPGNDSAAPDDVDGAVGGFSGIGLDIDVESEGAEGIDHDLGIFAPESAGEGDGTGGEGGQDEGAVGDALGAGDGDAELGGADEGEDFDEFWERHVW